MPTVIDAIHLWEAGQKDQAVQAWYAVPKEDKRAVLSNLDTKARVRPLAVESIVFGVQQRVDQTLQRHELGQVEADLLIKVGFWAGAQGDALAKMGYDDQADRIYAIIEPLLKEAALG